MKNITLYLNYYLYFLVAITTSTLSAQSTANYNISVSTTWNATNHGSAALNNDIPSSAHWSALALVTHKNNHAFLQLGELASQGVQDIAELGATGNFQNEVNAAISNLDADQYLQSGFSPFGAISSASINNITVSETYPLVTFLSMIAPSPDWFIAVNSETLRSGNNSINKGWKDTYTIDLFAYDAGTDDGADYTSANVLSNPKVGIFMINDAPINGIKVATATFTLNSTLSNLDIENISTFSIFPNPVTNGEIYISNNKQTPIVHIEIYSILGQLVKQPFIPNKDSKIQLDVSNLKSGIYLIRMYSETGKSSSQKLIIK